MTPFAFALSSAAMNSVHVVGAFAMPASFRTFGLYQSTFARWMFTGTEYRWPLYLIWLINDAGITLSKWYCL